MVRKWKWSLLAKDRQNLHHPMQRLFAYLHMFDP